MNVKVFLVKYIELPNLDILNELEKINALAEVANNDNFYSVDIEVVKKNSTNNELLQDFLRTIYKIFKTNDIQYVNIAIF